MGSRRSFDSDELGAAGGSPTFHGKERIPKSWANLKLGIKGSDPLLGMHRDAYESRCEIFVFQIEVEEIVF